jgi:hypothetical protein
MPIQYADDEACFSEASRGSSEVPEKPWYPVKPEGFGPWIERAYGESLPQDLSGEVEIFALSDWNRKRKSMGSRGPVGDFSFDDIGTEPNTVDNFICAYAIEED